jgi:hypothetical protein
LNHDRGSFDSTGEQDQSQESGMHGSVDVAAPAPAFAAPSEKADVRPLDPNLLFGGISLVVFLIAIVTGVQGAWY